MSSLKLIKQSTIFIDFDGTLIDNQKRQFSVYEQVASSLKLKKRLKAKSYWQIRRQGVSFADLFKNEHLIDDSPRINKKYMQLVENRQLLKADRIIKNVRRTLKAFSGKHNLVLVSLRAKKNNFRLQLKNLGLRDFFDEINVSGSGRNPIKTKERLIKQSLFYKQKNRYLIGDTEVDILVGKKTRCTVIAVCSGIRSAEFLSKYGPEYLIKDISKAELVVKG